MCTKLADIERFMMADIPEREYPYEQPLPENVRYHPCRLEVDVPVVDVLRGAYEADMVELLVIGVTKDGREQVFSSKADAATNVYLCNRALHFINQTMDDKQSELRDDPPTAA